MNKKRQVFLVTFFLGFAGIGLLVTALCTDYWLESNPVRLVDEDTLNAAVNVTDEESNTKFTGYIHFGLFRGSKTLDYGFGQRRYDIFGKKH